MPRSVSDSARATGRRRRRRLRAAGAVVALAALFAGAFFAVTRWLGGVAATSECIATAAGTSFTLEVDQTGNAALIAAIAHKRGLPARAVTIALATALQESKLRNIAHGDLDSVGLFQQRPSQGWGTEAQILDPVYATNAFFDALVKVKGYETMDIAAAAQRVQRSGFPTAYAKHEGIARVFASALTGETPRGVVCRLGDPSAPSAPTTAAAELTRLSGERGILQDGGLAVSTDSARTAWAVAGWAVGRAELNAVTSVQVGDRVWTRGSDDAATTWASADQPIGATQVRVSFAR